MAVEAREISATAVARDGVHWCSTGRAWRRGIELEHGRVEALLDYWLGRVDVSLYVSRKPVCWNIDLAAPWQHVPQPFIVVKKVQLVLDDRAANGTGPRIAVREEARSLWIVGIIEPIVRVQVAAIPIPFGVSVERIAPRLRCKVHVDRCGAPVLPGVTVRYECYFLNFVRPQHVVARARVVQVVVWVIHVSAVDRIK